MPLTPVTGSPPAPLGAGVSAARAATVAALRGDQFTPLLLSEQRGSGAAGKCAWQLTTLSGLSTEDRAAVAWLIADRLMRSRCGKSPAYQSWRTSATTGVPLSGHDQERVIAFIRDVFGTPANPGALDHVEGHVAEWLWFLLMGERVETDRVVVLLEAPKFAVTEPGPDGFVVYEVGGPPLVFRLWEIKKHTGKSGLSATTREAYQQLSSQGDRYLAQLTAMHADKDGDVGALCAELVDLWVDANERAGAGVGVASGTVPAPRRCFTAMGKHLAQFAQPGQLEAMLCAVESYGDLALEVRARDEITAGRLGVSVSWG